MSGMYTQPNPYPTPPRRNGPDAFLIVIITLAGLMLMFGGCAVLLAATSSGKPVTETAATSTGRDALPVASAEPTAQDTTSGSGQDIVITECTTEPSSTLAFAVAKITVTNHGNVRRSYGHQIEFVDRSGNRIANSYLSVRNLAPGQSTTETVKAILDNPEATVNACRTLD